MRTQSDVMAPMEDLSTNGEYLNRYLKIFIVHFL